MRLLREYIEKACITLGIDESHGLKHAIGTMRYASYLINSLKDITEEERHMAMYAAGLHDLCDSKYTDVNIAAADIKKWLIEIHWAEKTADALIAIITTMSYSKLKKADNENGSHVFPDHGKWQRAYEIARNADLLESYVVARCVLYNKHIYPEKTEDEHWANAEELFNQRVYRYIKDNWITLPGALALVPSLEEEARRCFRERSMDWPYDKN
jgi:hypothetical protein